MKLGSLKEGGRDGTLVVVSRDLSRAVRATGIAPTLQRALEDWDSAAPRLNALYDSLNEGDADGVFDLEMASLASPLPPLSLLLPQAIRLNAITAAKNIATTFFFMVLFSFTLVFLETMHRRRLPQVYKKAAPPMAEPLRCIRCQRVMRLSVPMAYVQRRPVPAVPAPERK